MNPLVNSLNLYKSEKSIYGAIMICATLIGFSKLLMLANVLGVSEFGKYVFFISLEAYLIPLCTLGLMEAIFREYPILLGKGKIQKAYELRNKSLFIIIRLLILQSTIVGAACLIFSFHNFEALFLWGAIGMGHLVANIHFFWALREVRSRLKSIEYALMLTGRLIIDCTLLLLFYKKFGLFTYLATEIIVLTLLNCILYQRIPELKLIKKPTISKTMYRNGFSLFGTSTIGSLSMSGDRLFLGATLPAVFFSVYAFHGIVFQAGQSISNIIHQYMQPSVMHAYGKDESIDAIIARLNQFLLKIIFISIIFSPLVWVVASFITENFVRQFHLSPVLFLSLFFAAVLNIGNIYSLIFIATKKFKTLYSIQFISSSMLLFLLSCGVIFDASLEYYGMAFSLIGACLLVYYFGEQNT